MARLRNDKCAISSQLALGHGDILVSIFSELGAHHFRLTQTYRGMLIVKLTRCEKTSGWSECLPCSYRFKKRSVAMPLKADVALAVGSLDIRGPAHGRTLEIPAMCNVWHRLAMPPLESLADKMSFPPPAQGINSRDPTASNLSDEALPP